MKFLKNNKILTIREAVPDDAEEILEVLKKIGGETDNLIIDSNGVPLTVEDERKYLENNLKSVTNKTFIGIVDNKIVATSGINGSSRERVKHNVVLGMSILKEYWNLGIGFYIIQNIIAYCQMSKVIRNITLEVRADNAAAIHLYEKVGFIYVGKFKDKMCVNGKYFDNLIYEKQIL